MPSGQPDFYSATVPSMSVYGEGQTNWMLAEDGDIAGLGSADLVEYRVPEGYELHLMGGAFGSDHPAVTKYSIVVMGIETYIGYFDTQVTNPLHPAAAMVVPPFLIIALRIYNEDELQHHYAVLGLGFLVKIAE